MVQRNCVATLRAVPSLRRADERGDAAPSCWCRPAPGSSAARTWWPTARRKAFDMVMAEALWAELHGAGVDVLGLVLGPDGHARAATAAPAARSDRPIRRPDSRCGDSRAGRRHRALANLSNGPTASPVTTSGWVTRRSEAMSRNDAVRMMLQVAGGVMGRRRGGPGMTGRVDARFATTSPTSSSVTRRVSTAAIGPVPQLLCRGLRGGLRRHRSVAQRRGDHNVDAGRPRAVRSHDAPHHECGGRPDRRGVTARSYVDAIVLGPDNQTGARAPGTTTTSWSRPTTGGRSCAAVSRWCSSRACASVKPSWATGSEHCGLDEVPDALQQARVGEGPPRRRCLSQPVNGRARYATTTRTRPRFWIRACRVSVSPWRWVVTRRAGK